MSELYDAVRKAKQLYESSDYTGANTGLRDFLLHMRERRYYNAAEAFF